MQTPRRIALLSALLVPLGLGCRSGGGGPQTTITGGEGHLPVTELDSGLTLSRDLEIQKIASVRKSGFLVVEFELHNKRGSTIDLEWKVDWMDSSGLSIPTSGSWRPLSIGGRGYEPLQVTAPTPEATTWKLRVQKPNPVR